MTATTAGRTEAPANESERAAQLASAQVWVWRYLRFLGAAPHLAEDLTQETLLAALGADVLDRNLEALRGWLQTTARNLFYAHARRARRQGSALDFADIEPEIAERAWSWFVATSDHDATGQQALEDLEKCRQTLSERERNALSQRYHEGVSREEIASQLDISAAGVKALLRRVRDRLRSCIERRRQDRAS